MKTRTNILFYFFLLTFAFILCPLSFLLVSCNTTEPPPPVNGNNKPKPKITLTVDDTSPTEVWVNLITENISLPDTLKLIRNNDTVKTIELFDSNYVIYDDLLLPSQSYSYQVSSIEYQVLSEQVTAVTMDTTSHNFSWEVFEFGEHGNSILRDVAIIDENNIWAVGAIYLKDSTGANDSKAYNVLHWDGSELELSRATNVPLNAIYAFSNEDIWAFSSAPYHYDGETWTPHNITGLFDGYVYGVWGTSSSDIYIVGGNGSIAHYNGTSWRKIESGTELTLSDIYGTNTGEVYVSGVQFSTVSGVLLKGNSSGFTVVKNSGIIDESQLFEQLYGELASVWIDEKGTVYSGGNFLYWQQRGKWNYVTNLPANYLGGNPGSLYRGFISSIRGNASNDYVIAGERNTLRHYNGINWNQIGMDYNPNSPIDWYTVRQKENSIAAVGTIGNKAIITKLKR